MPIMNRTRMNATWHSRWQAACRAENLARRREASNLLSGVATILLLSTLALWIAIISERI
jgi:hypothetical protein